MTFDVEVLLKGTDAVVTETITHEAETSAWADADVREVLLATLRVFARASGDDTAEGDVSLRGLSWIVTETEGGVAIAIEIPSGAIAAGPFDIAADELTQMVARVISADVPTSTVVH